MNKYLNDSTPLDWRIEKISEATEIKVGRDLLEEYFSKEFSDEFNVPVYSNSHENKGLYGYYNIKEYTGSSVTVVGRGDVGLAFPRIGSFGAIGRLIVLFPKEWLDHRYLAEYINFNVKFHQESSAVPQLTGKQIGTYDIPVPPLPEQQKIAGILSTVDEKIDLIDQQISETQALKKGLMQRLLIKGIGHTKFKDSPLGEIPESWEMVRLGDACKIIMGQSPNGDAYNKNGTGLPVLNGPTEFTKLHPIPVQYTTEVTKVCLKNDVLFCVRGSTTGRMNVADQEYCIGRGLAAIRGNEKSLTLFIKFVLQKLAKEVLRKAKDMGSTFPNINSKELNVFLFGLPSFEEQQKIAAILSSVDGKIEVLEEKKTCYQELKKGLMQQLLTGKIRVNTLIDNTAMA